MIEMISRKLVVCDGVVRKLAPRRPFFAEFDTRVVGSPHDNGWFTEKPFATAHSQQPAASSFRAATPVRVSEA